MLLLIGLVCNILEIDRIIIYESISGVINCLVELAFTSKIVLAMPLISLSFDELVYIFRWLESSLRYLLIWIFIFIHCGYEIFTVFVSVWDIGIILFRHIKYHHFLLRSLIILVVISMVNKICFVGYFVNIHVVTIDLNLIFLWWTWITRPKLIILIIFIFATWVWLVFNDIKWMDLTLNGWFLAVLNFTGAELWFNVLTDLLFLIGSPFVL